MIRALRRGLTDPAHRWMMATTGRSEPERAGGLVAATVGAICLLAYQLLPLPVAALAAAAFLALAWSRPLGAACAIILALPYHEVLRPVVGAWGFSAAEVGICLAALATAARLVAERARRWASLGRFFPPQLDEARLSLRYLDVLAILLVCVGVASLLVSIKPWESLRALRQTVVEPVLLYTVVVGAGGGRVTARRLLLALVASAVAVSLVGIYQYAANENIITAEESLRRIRGLYGSPNHLGMFLGRAFPVALALAALGGTRRGLFAGALLPIGVALVLTFSVGAWVGVAAAVVAVALYFGRRVVLSGGAAALVLCAVSLPALLRVERIASHLDFSEGTSFLRLQLWGSALDLVWDHPLAGVGLDNFLYYYRDLGYMLPGGWREPSLSHPHNLALDFWLSLGLIGLLLFSVLLYRFYRDAWRVVRRSPVRGDRALALAALASMTDFVAHGLIDASYFRPDLSVVFWLTVAILRLLPPVPASGHAAAGGSGVPDRIEVRAPTGQEERA